MDTLQDTASLHTADIRRAGRDLLSLALMDARNRTLHWLSVYEDRLGADLPVSESPELLPPLWLAGHIGWFQERWIARNVQRGRGTGCDPQAAGLASIEHQADRWYDPSLLTHEARWQLDLPDAQETKQYLADTMEVTLELLEAAEESDDGLYFFRLALFHEDLRGETFATMAQTLDFDLRAAGAALPEIASQPPREPLLFPAMRHTLGSRPRGFVFDNEKWAHEVALPEFEIDAVPVTWAQYAEFVEDGGYDEAAHWSAAGWDWVRRGERRVPRHVDQMRQGVMQQRFGRLARVPLAQPALHLCWYEADAWCRWAGRRLPAEVEWEAAACSGRSRGFQHGSVWEWVASSLRPYPGFSPDPWRDYSEPAFGSHKVLRGGSFATHGRLRDPKFRGFALPVRDDLFTGFRSCSL